MLATKLIQVSRQAYKFRASWAGADSTTSLGTADTGQTFTQTGGPFGISSHQAYKATTGADAWALADIGAPVRGTLRCALKVGASGQTADAGLAVAAFDANTGLIVILGNSGGGSPSTSYCQCYKRVGGSYTLLGGSSSAAGLTLGNTYSLQITFDGVTIGVSGVPVPYNITLSSGDQSTFAAASKLGLRSGGSEVGSSRWGAVTLR